MPPSACGASFKIMALRTRTHDGRLNGVSAPPRLSLQNRWLPEMDPGGSTKHDVSDGYHRKTYPTFPQFPPTPQPTQPHQRQALVSRNVLRWHARAKTRLQPQPTAVVSMRQGAYVLQETEALRMHPGPTSASCRPSRAKLAAYVPAIVVHAPAPVPRSVALQTAISVNGPEHWHGNARVPAEACLSDLT